MTRTRNGLLLAVILGTILLRVATAAEEHGGLHQTAGGVSVYLGVAPAQTIRGHEPGHPERLMHGGVPKGKHSYHVMVALFDEASGQRIADAKVRARVAEVGLAGQDKALEPMVIAGSASFGNYFTMAAPGPYQIAVSIRRPGAARPVEVQFVH